MSEDWSTQKIKGELTLRGRTLADVSRSARLDRTAGSIALKRRWPKAEKAIADALGVQPETIWPSRYSKKSKSTCGDSQQ